MWLYTRYGFYSAVQKHNEEGITVRSYNKEDLKNLVSRFQLDVPIIYTPNNDYTYRIKITRGVWGTIVGELALDVDYENFKGEIAKTQSWQRIAGYMAIHDKTYEATATCTRRHKVR